MWIWCRTMCATHWNPDKEKPLWLRLTLVVRTNSSEVTGSSSGSMHRVEPLISCSTASILYSTKSFTLSINSSRSTAVWRGEKQWCIECKEQKKNWRKISWTSSGPGGGRAARCLALPDMACSTLTFRGVSAYPKPCRCGRGICRYWETSSWGRSGPAGWRRPPAHSAIMDACCVTAAECRDAILSPVPCQEFIVTHVFNLKFSGNWINKTLQLLYIFIHWFSFPSVIIFCLWPSSIQHYLQNNFNKSRTLLLRIFPEPLRLITSPMLSKIPPLAFRGPPPACSSSTPSRTLSSSSSTADGMWNVFSRFKPSFSVWPSYCFFVFCPLPYHPLFPVKCSWQFWKARINKMYHEVPLLNALCLLLLWLLSSAVLFRGGHREPSASIEPSPPLQPLLSHRLTSRPVLLSPEISSLYIIL